MPTTAVATRQPRIRHIEASRCLRIEVDNTSSDPPPMGRFRLNDTRGRGVIIVDKLAEDCGVTGTRSERPSGPSSSATNHDLSRPLKDHPADWLPSGAAETCH